MVKLTKFLLKISIGIEKCKRKMTDIDSQIIKFKETTKKFLLHKLILYLLCIINQFKTRYIQNIYKKITFHFYRNIKFYVDSQEEKNVFLLSLYFFKSQSYRYICEVHRQMADMNIPVWLEF